MKLSVKRKSHLPAGRGARVLIYGFGPYLQYRRNVTGDVLRRLPRASWLGKIVFPVRFDRRQFVAAVRTHQPDVILGLGQCSSGRLLRVEKRAHNRRRSGPRAEARAIVPGGVTSHATTLDLKLGRNRMVSTHAGEYVCNYSMYVLLDFVESQQLPVRFGFIHIPHDYDPVRAATIVLNGIVRLRRRAR